MMSTNNTVEISQLDLRYESYRIKQPKLEKSILLSILEKGICEPLRGISNGDVTILLDGFKRIRCAKQLSITSVPYQSIETDEAMGIIRLMRESFSTRLNVIEQIKLIEALKKNHGMSIQEIAEHLGKSPAWVSIRVKMNRQLTPKLTGQILSGRFPVRSYLYTILPLTRVNKIKNEEIERFVKGVSGHHLSTRQIGLLAEEYFNGNSTIIEQIDGDKPKWALECLQKEQNSGAVGCSTLECSVLRVLENIRKGIRQFELHHADPKLHSSAFFAQADLLIGGLLEDIKGFTQALRRLHDRTG